MPNKPTRWGRAHWSALLLLPVLLYWLFWLTSNLANDDSQERVVMFYSIIPRTILFIPVHLIVLLLTSAALSFAIKEKMVRRIRWYKTPKYLQFLILVSGVLLFTCVLQFMM